VSAVTTFPKDPSTVLARTIKQHENRLRVAEQRINVLATQNAALKALLSGNVTIGGNLTVDGALTVDGNATLRSNLSISSPANTTPGPAPALGSSGFGGGVWTGSQQTALLTLQNVVNDIIYNLVNQQIFS
jgi:hypothetical protein